MTWKELEKKCDDWDAQIELIAGMLPDIPNPITTKSTVNDYIDYLDSICRFFGVKELRFTGDMVLNYGGMYSVRDNSIEIAYPISQGLQKWRIQKIFPHELAHHIIHLHGLYDKEFSKNLWNRSSFPKYCLFGLRDEQATRKLTSHIAKKYFPNTRYSKKDYEKQDFETEMYYLSFYYINKIGMVGF